MQQSFTPNFSMHPVGKTMCWIDKRFPHILMISSSSVTIQSLGKIVLCALAVGVKICCWFFCQASGCQRAVHLKGTFFEQVLRRRLWVDFDSVFINFLEGIVLSDTLESSHFRRQVVPQFSSNCVRKLQKVQKSAEKLHRTSYIQMTEMRDLKKFPLQ